MLPNCMSISGHCVRAATSALLPPAPPPIHSFAPTDLCSGTDATTDDLGSKRKVGTGSAALAALKSPARSPSSYLGGAGSSDGLLAGTRIQGEHQHVEQQQQHSPVPSPHPLPPAVASSSAVAPLQVPDALRQGYRRVDRSGGVDLNGMRYFSTYDILHRSPGNKC
jgi:hypothetical protein